MLLPCAVPIISSLCFCTQSQEAEHSQKLHVAEGAVCNAREGVGGRRGWTGAGGFQIPAQMRGGGAGGSSSSTMRWSRVVPAPCFFPTLQKIKLSEKQGIYEELERGWGSLSLPAVSATPCPKALMVPWQCQDVLFWSWCCEQCGCYCLSLVGTSSLWDSVSLHSYWAIFIGKTLLLSDTFLEKIIAPSGVFGHYSFLWGFRDIQVDGKTEE